MSFNNWNVEENIWDFTSDKITNTANSAIGCFQALDGKEMLSISQKNEGFSNPTSETSWFLFQSF